MPSIFDTLQGVAKMKEGKGVKKEALSTEVFEALGPGTKMQIHDSFRMHFLDFNKGFSD